MVTSTSAHDATWSFPLACTRLASHGAAGSGPLVASGTGFHLVYVRSGSALVRGCSGRLACQGPVLICLNEDDWLELESGHALDGEIVSFDPAIINDRFADRRLLADPGMNGTTLAQDRFYLLPFVERSDMVRACLELSPAMLPLLEDRLVRMNEQLERQPGYWPCRARSFLLELLFSANQIFLDPPSQAKPDSPPGPGAIRRLPAEPHSLEPVLQYLDTNFASDLALDELARRFGTNRTTLNQRFQALCGMSVMAYVIQLRLRFAALLLRDTALPVAEVMERVGFADLTHFGRMFRKGYQMSPVEYRTAHSWLYRPASRAS